MCTLPLHIILCTSSAASCRESKGAIGRGLVLHHRIKVILPTVSGTTVRSRSDADCLHGYKYTLHIQNCIKGRK